MFYIPWFDKIFVINKLVLLYAKANEILRSRHMKIYLDIFFLVNFLMNVFIFQIMNVFCRKKPVTRRSLLASALGALAAVAVVVSGIRDRMGIFLILYLLVSCLLVRIAYGKTTMPGMFRYIGGYYLAGVFTAGGMMLLKSIAGLKQVSLVFLLLAAVILFCFAQKLAVSGKHPASGGQKVFPVQITYNGKSVTGTAFLDTGNHLKEPVSREPVSIVEFELFRKMLSEGERDDFRKVLQDMEPELFGKLLLRYIPFHSLGRAADRMVGVRVEDMEIHMDDGNTVHTGKTWLGICDRFLSSDSEYEVLLNSRIFGK